MDLKGERQTLAHFLEVWLKETQRPKLRPSTIKSYESYIATHINPKLGHLTLGELTAQDVQRFLNACAHDGRVRKSKANAEPASDNNHGKPTGLSPRSVQYIRAILRAALRQALRWGYVERHVAALASPPRQKPKQTEALSADEARQLMDETRDDRLGTLFATALFTGMRQGELLGLRWPDVDLDAGTIRVRQAVQKIDMAWQEYGLVFPSALGTPLDGSNVTHHMQRRLAAADLPQVTFHALRHTCGTLLHQEGVPARTIMEILGHSQITLILGTYCHATDAMFDEAAGALARALGGAR